MDREKQQLFFRVLGRVCKVLLGWVLYVVLSYALWCMVQQTPSEEHYSGFIAFLAYAAVSFFFFDFLKKGCKPGRGGLFVLACMLSAMAATGILIALNRGIPLERLFC